VIQGLNIPDHPSSVTLLIWADEFMNFIKLLSLTAPMSGAVLLFGRLKNTGRALGAAGKTEARVLSFNCMEKVHTMG
jgi:hypothetical protein